MADRRAISTDRAPAAIGPYSQAIVAGGLVFASGQIALVPGTMELETGDIGTETHRVLGNLQAVLDAAGSGLHRAVKVTIFLSDMSLYPAVNEVYATYFTEMPPAREAVAVKGLPKGVNVEISAIATVG